MESEAVQNIFNQAHATTRTDRRLAICILALTLFSYAYIFQGLGWNQMAHLGTIRFIVERGTADIAPLADLTHGTMVLGTRRYSNKPPGLVLMGVPIYFALFHVESWLGISTDHPAVWLRNMHVLTVLLCGLPAAILNVLLYLAFRRERATPRAAMLLAGGFAFGSLTLPYAGIFMSHVLCSMFVFAAWYRLTSQELRPSNALLAGVFLGCGNLCDLLTVVMTLNLGIYLLARRTSVRHLIAFTIGPFTALLVLLIYDRLAYGSATQISAFHQTYFYHPNMLFGLFDRPDIRHIYWITYQPMRGLFACCPEFVLCLLAVLAVRRNSFHFRMDLAVILPMLAGYLVFYATLFGWTGGYGVGPRYLIPLLPLLWMFALGPFHRWPMICGPVIVLSIFCMLAVTSVCPIAPVINDSGRPTKDDPVEDDLIPFLHGEVTDVWMSETLGGLVGIPKRFLIVPFLLPVAAYFSIALGLPRRQQQIARSANVCTE